MTAFDVAVVGAGPAGASAALELASRGASVLLFERERLPRYKTCGGGLVGRARRLLTIDVEDTVERECHVAEVRALDSDAGFTVSREGPLISMTMRDRLDARIVEAARDAGVRVKERCEVRTLRNARGAVRVETEAEIVKAGFAIAADGATGRSARSAGWGDDRRLIPALESEVVVDAATLARFEGQARFDFDVVPHGYAWVFPKARHLSIGVLSARRGRVHLPAHLEAYMERLGIGELEGESRHGYVIPIAPRAEGFVRGRILLAGDAAGFAEPLTGEGISFAILSGRLAAAAVAVGQLEPEGVGGRYEAAVAEEILPELRIGRRLARFAYGPRMLRAMLIRRLGDRLGRGLADVFSGRATYREQFRDPRDYLALRRPRRRGRPRTDRGYTGPG
jgi:geranylgeranyl reductase family protein